MMLRGINGTFVYACDVDLRDYLKQHIDAYKPAVGKFTKPVATLVPYVNAVPFYDLQAAAGGFSELQHVEHENWVAVPQGVAVGKSLFACRVVGESMNKIIPNGSICLFRMNPGGSRNGKIVLVECADTQDGDAGSRYTVKEYESIKIDTEEGWHHEQIRLKPRSTDTNLATLELSNDDEYRYRVVGEFICVIS